MTLAPPGRPTDPAVGHDAIARYHALLASPGLAADTTADLSAAQDRRNLRVGGRPVCTCLRPRFLTPRRYRFARGRAHQLLPAVRAVYDRAVADPPFRRQLRLRDWEEELFAVDPGYRHPVAAGRLDGFLTADGRLRFTEYNADAPAGAGYADALADVFLGLPAVRRFAQKFRLTPLPCRPGLVRALTAAYRQWAGAGRPARPAVAIVDWADVPTGPEFGLLVDYLRAAEYDARTADPRHLEFAGGRLWAGGRPVDLVYKRVLLGELVGRCGLSHPLVRAARARAVCVVNSFRCRLLARKAAFAALTDERNADMFGPAQRRAIAAHVPWTRVVEDRKTVIDGRQVDLVPFVLAHPDRFVLKPNDGSGGLGVVIGATAGPGWGPAVAAALAADPWVVQERVAAAVEPFPVATPDGVAVADRVVDTGLFVTAGAQVHGCLTRAAAGPVVATGAAGGGALPTFLVEPR